MAVRTKVFLTFLFVFVGVIAWFFGVVGMTFQEVSCGSDGGFACLNPIVALAVLLGKVLQPILSPIPHFIFSLTTNINSIFFLVIFGLLVKYLLLAIFALIPFWGFNFALKFFYGGKDYWQILKKRYWLMYLTTVLVLLNTNIISDVVTTTQSPYISKVCQGNNKCERAFINEDNILTFDGLDFPKVRLFYSGIKDDKVYLADEERIRWCQETTSKHNYYVECLSEMNVLDPQAVTLEDCIIFGKSISYPPPLETIEVCFNQHFDIEPISVAVITGALEGEQYTRVDQNGEEKILD